MNIDRRLVWDYPVGAGGEDDEAFRRWYVARVLARGGIDDVRALGFETIREYLPRIAIPRRVRDFWHWYFDLPDSHGDPDRRAARAR
ncbi:MAG: hypothetical protein ACREMB_17630 [Candidatus Rokuibacteriota bacterium]